MAPMQPPRVLVAPFTSISTSQSRFTGFSAHAIFFVLPARSGAVRRFVCASLVDHLAREGVGYVSMSFFHSTWHGGRYSSSRVFRSLLLGRARELVALSMVTSDTIHRAKVCANEYRACVGFGG